MNDERPLHVRVTEKLGISECTAWRLWGTGLSGPEYTNDGCQHKYNCVPVGKVLRYDESWALTGPIIERLYLTVRPSTYSSHWVAERAASRAGSSGETALIAVCKLILSLPDEVVRDSSQVA